MDFEAFWSRLIAADSRLRNTGTRIIIDVGELRRNLEVAFRAGRGYFPSTLQDLQGRLGKALK